MNSQAALFDWEGHVLAPAASEQARNLARVEGRQATDILSWLENRVAMGQPTFHMADLESAVRGTPGSAGRVLRSLRQQGHVDVVNVDRAGSLYEIRGLR